MPKIRVLRILEYTYESVDAMVADQIRWYTGVHGTKNNRWQTIKSTTLPIEVLEDISDSDDQG